MSIWRVPSPPFFLRFLVERALNRDETTVLPHRVKLLDFEYARQIFAGYEIDAISIAAGVAVENRERRGIRVGSIRTF